MLLYLRGFELRELFRTEVRENVVLDILDIPCVCALTQDGLFVFFEPPLEPFSKGDGAILGQLHPCVLLFEFGKFWHQLTLLLGKDRTVYRVAVLFMTNDDARFPAAVASFSDESVTRRTSFSHIFVSFLLIFSRQTIPQRSEHIQTKAEELSVCYQFLSTVEKNLFCEFPRFVLTSYQYYDKI